MSEAFEVVWPLGKQADAPPAEVKEHKPLDLNSARVAFVWTYNRKGDQMFSIMKSMLRGEYPDIAFVDYEEFGNIHGASETEIIAALPQLLRQHKADVAVIGVAG